MATTPRPTVHFGANGDYKAGTYIVQLRELPASSYTGGIAGYSRTRPAKGHQLNATSSTVKKYSTFLSKKQSTLTAQYGIRAIHHYTLAYNGFAAKLTAAQANSLALNKDVAKLSPDRILKVQDDNLTSKSSLNYLKVADTATGGDPSNGLWNAIGGHENAGKGIVVGDVDTGIAPQNPSFAGDPLGTTESDTVPYLDGSTITFHKSDGNTFTSPEIGTADNWNNSYYSTKLIGAQYFDQGLLADGGEIAPHPTATDPGDYTSPRDGDDHGSHTASTAAGDYGVDATVDGVDYGTISGVAPAAKIAVYKACWNAPDPANDGCDETDLVAAIDAAVHDGVDVINYSIGGDAAQTIYSPTDEAFLNAATAGIFVSAAAGNAGPDPTTLDNASPWETTVAASTIPSYEATVVLGNGKKYDGASITVRGSVQNDGSTVQPSTDAITNAPVILASSANKSGVPSSHATDCRARSLDPAKVKNKVVVCDRDGLVDRTEMSATVAADGGIGAILVNTTPGDVDTDAHSVPTVHLDQPDRSAVRSYAATKGATVSFVAGNTTGTPTPVPQIAGFSSRGPVTAGDEDTLKPDIAAPGVSILAAYADAPTATSTALTPQWGFDSGTSMATPHITGLAALYLGEHPNATPAEVKSAMMTTATDTVTASGGDFTDPFSQGAGEVNPSDFLNPGLVYLATTADWQAYIAGTGEATFPDTAPIDPSDLNQASIAIGALSGSQVVHRSVTAKVSGTFDASITGLAGISATVSPSSIPVTAGQTVDFTVTFSRTTAKIGAFSTGFLTWTDSADHLTVRSPLAVQPVSVPPKASGSGTNGHVDISTTIGKTETVATHAYGLAPKTPWAKSTDSFGYPATNFTDASDPLPDGSSSFDEADFFQYHPTSTQFVKWEVAPTGSNTAGTDLDLYIFYSKTSTKDPSKWVGVTASATPSADESVELYKPKAGYYWAIVDPYAVPNGGVNFQLSSWEAKTSGGSGHLTAPTSIKATASGSTPLRVSWGGLTPNTDYLGVVGYGTGTTHTVLTVDSGATTAPENYTAPSITGTPVVGGKLTVSPGTWNVPTSALALTYQWNRDGDPISQATKSTYTPTADDRTHELTVDVTATLGGSTTVTTDGVVPLARSAASFTISPSPVVHGKTETLVIHITSPDGTTGLAATGYFRRSTSSTTAKYPFTTDSSGTATITFPAPASAKAYPFQVVWPGNDEYAPVTYTHTVTVH